MRNIHSEDKRKLRADLCHAANGLCQYCGTRVKLASGTVDHHIPQSHGGTNARANLRWCCRVCNSVKGDMSPSEWQKFLPIMKAQARMPERDRMGLLMMVSRRAREMGMR